jgi:nucleolar protein 58
MASFIMSSQIAFAYSERACCTERLQECCILLQSIVLYNLLDSKANKYSQRVKEWYGWHFPELCKFVEDDVEFVQVVEKIGDRKNTSTCDLSDVLPKSIEMQVREAAKISMGTEISEQDMMNILQTADQILETLEEKDSLLKHLEKRIETLAPNLILPNAPSSSVEILGAEKALFML